MAKKVINLQGNRSGLWSARKTCLVDFTNDYQLVIKIENLSVFLFKNLA